MTLDSDRYCLPSGYIERLEPEYFVDHDNSGVTWQPDVYPVTLALLKGHGRDTVIDLGCGRAGKLIGLHDGEPDLRLVGVDFGANIGWCQQHHAVGHWLEADLEAVEALPLPLPVIARSVVVCSDVLEHLVDPRPTMRLICWLLREGAARAVLSTPARDQRAGADHLGPPFNRSHVREWAQDEFRAFLEGFPVEIERFELTRSDDAGGGLSTQLVVLKELQR